MYKSTHPSQANAGACYGQAEAGPAIGSPIRPGECIPLPRGLKDLASAAFPPPNTINKRPELDLMKDSLADLCEQAQNILLRTRGAADRFLGPEPEEGISKEPMPVGDGAAIIAMQGYIYEVRRQLSMVQTQLARLETL